MVKKFLQRSLTIIGVALIMLSYSLAMEVQETSAYGRPERERGYARFHDGMKEKAKEAMSNAASLWYASDPEVNTKSLSAPRWVLADQFCSMATEEEYVRGGRVVCAGCNEFILVQNITRSFYQKYWLPEMERLCQDAYGAESSQYRWRFLAADEHIEIRVDAYEEAQPQVVRRAPRFSSIELRRDLSHL